MASKVTPKRRGLSQASAPKRSPVKTRREGLVSKPLSIRPERKTSLRIQTAEGWKREQLRKLEERQG